MSKKITGRTIRKWFLGGLVIVAGLTTFSAQAQFIEWLGTAALTEEMDLTGDAIGSSTHTVSNESRLTALAAAGASELVVVSGQTGTFFKDERRDILTQNFIVRRDPGEAAVARVRVSGGAEFQLAALPPAESQPIPNRSDFADLEVVSRVRLATGGGSSIVAFTRNFLSDGSMRSDRVHFSASNFLAVDTEYTLTMTATSAISRIWDGSTARSGNVDYAAWTTLSTVPETGTLSLLIFGLLGFGLVRRRRAG